MKNITLADVVPLIADLPFALTFTPSVLDRSGRPRILRY